MQKQLYHNNPILCGRCKQSLPYEKRHNKYCSSSCAATVNNQGKVRNPKKPRPACLHCGALTKNPKYCSNSCRRDFLKMLAQPQIEAGLIDNTKVLRRFLIERDGHKCSECALIEWRGQPIPLCLDHIDGNPANNRPANLWLICQNCHGLTPTFAGRNRGNGRKSRGILRYEHYKIPHAAKN